MRNTKYTLSVRVNDRIVDEYVDYKGETYIEGRRGSKYEISFTNHTGVRVMAIFSVDGLCSNDGKPASDQSGGYLVGPYATLTIPGWTIDDTKVAAFEFRPKGERANQTYVEELRQEGFDVDVSNQGVIGVMVISEKRRQRQHVNSRPRALIASSASPALYRTSHFGISTMDSFEPMGLYQMNMTTASPQMTYNGVSGSAAGLVATACAAPAVETPTMGTGFGEDMKFSTHKVSFDRDTVDSILTVRYETREKLKALGLISDTKKTVAQAFPNYKTDGCHVPKSRR